MASLFRKAIFFAKRRTQTLQNSILVRRILLFMVKIVTI